MLRGSAPWVLVAVLSLAAYVVNRYLVDPRIVDLATYRAEGAALREHRNLYGDIGAPAGLLATYPPFAAVLFVPLSLLSWPATQVVGNVVGGGLVGLVAWQSCRLAGIGRDRLLAATLALAAVALWCEPVYNTLSFGQVNLGVVALVLSDFLRPAGSRWRGVGTGLATGIKVAPGVVVLYLLLTGRLRMAATAAGTFVLTIAVSALLTPGGTKAYWTDLLFDTDRVGDVANGTNQSVQGMIARLTRTNAVSHAGTAAAFLALVLAAACAVYAYRRLGDPWGLCVIAVGGLLASPISWSHHWVWCVPLTAVVVAHRPRWLPLVLVYWSWLGFLLSRRASEILHFPAWQLFATNWYVVFGAAFVALAFVTARRVEGPARQPVLATT
ncbi:glycosyltransferase 87 family protein [Jatrophihabitans endophyticus]|uniref:glycosyltransferase 87 family protein n=1 Tax=Jatrophihabitans endophyticus TaxID=1206085 RepID=UPI000933789D|nr:glycosyltransferase 87 family protein [Jatrophihabitans endophyticus]